MTPPPLPPINNTIVGSGTAQSDFPNLTSVRNVHVASVEDEYFDSTSHFDSDVCDEFLGDSDNMDETEITPPYGTSLFAVNEPGSVQIAGGHKDEVAVSRAPLADFPSKIPKA